jgi:hypothetical protein
MPKSAAPLSAASSLAAAALLACAGWLGACSSNRVATTNHWNAAYIPHRVTYQFTGYRGATDGSYFGFLGGEMSALGMSLSRHLWHYNSDNPMQNGKTDREDPPRPPRQDFEVANEKSPRRIH